MQIALDRAMALQRGLPWEFIGRSPSGSHSPTLVTMLDRERYHEIEVCTNCLPFAEQEEWFQWYSRVRTGSL
jgi:hypothetical protein